MTKRNAQYLVEDKPKTIKILHFPNVLLFATMGSVDLVEPGQGGRRRK